MDVKQAEYIVAIAKENNITRAAEKLFLTQSALNQQLLKLEKELGAPLFVRSRTDWRPTEAGAVYIENAKKMLQLKEDTYRRIGDMTGAKKGTLSVGLTPGRGIPMFTSVYPAFHRDYPNITVTPIELSVRGQQDQILRGELDIGFLTLREEDYRPNLRYRVLCQEEILLVAPLGHPMANKTDSQLTAADLGEFRQDSFVSIYRDSSLRPLVDDVFAGAGYRPQVLFETSSNAAIVKMASSGLCCGMVPCFYIQGHRDQVACFHLPGRPAWEITACYRTGAYLSQGAQAFIGLAAEFWQGQFPGEASSTGSA